MADSATAARIKAALERAADIDLHHNRIDVIGGSDIRLEGEVSNIAVKRRALQIARELANGKVEDRLLLRVERKRVDSELLQAVLDALTSEPVFRDFVIRPRQGDAPPEQRDWIEVDVDGPRVRLYGQAWSLSHRRLAEILAWWVPGTADVDNRIRVQPAEQDNDAEISDAVRLVLDKDPSLDAEQIRITTRNGEVYLQGTVTSDVNRRMADYDCWYIPGVHKVHNDLQVRSSRY